MSLFGEFPPTTSDIQRIEKKVAEINNILIQKEKDIESLIKLLSDLLKINEMHHQQTDELHAKFLKELEIMKLREIINNKKQEIQNKKS